MAVEVVSGVGARYGVLIPLDADGLPSVNVSQAAPIQGSLVQGIKTMTVNDPDPQRIDHYGDDYPFAQDSLPATSVGSFTIGTAKTNLALDSMAEGNKLVAIDSTQWRAGNTDKKGQEPFVGFMAYRQAVDTKKASATFGKKRQWNLKIFPSSRITPKGQSMEQGAVEKMYAATPTNVTQTIWGETFSETTWGNSIAEYTEGVTDYQPRLCWHLGNGTITAFQLSHPPAAASALHVWVGGTLVSPVTINTSSTNPAFTLGAAPGVGIKVIELIETLIPGNN